MVAVLLAVPQGYLTGAISGTSTFNNATFASLGITPGTYTWTWGTGMHADSFTIETVPDTGTTFPCSVSLRSAWLPCGANCAAKASSGGLAFGGGSPS